MSETPSTKSAEITEMSFLNEKSRMIISAAGIFFSYTIFGMLQEKITRGRYGKEMNEDGTIGERFTFTLALVGVQCFCNWFFVKGKYWRIIETNNHVIWNKMLQFQLFLSRVHNRLTRLTQDTMQAVLSLISWQWWAATWLWDGLRIPHRWLQKLLSRFPWWYSACYWAGNPTQHRSTSSFCSLSSVSWFLCTKRDKSIQTPKMLASVKFCCFWVSRWMDSLERFRREWEQPPGLRRNIWCWLWITGVVWCWALLWSCPGREKLFSLSRSSIQSSTDISQLWHWLALSVNFSSLWWCHMLVRFHALSSPLRGNSLQFCSRWCSSVICWRFDSGLEPFWYSPGFSLTCFWGRNQLEMTRKASNRSDCCSTIKKNLKTSRIICTKRDWRTVESVGRETYKEKFHGPTLSAIFKVNFHVVWPKSCR